jgi:hypothetical protein
VPPQKAVKEPRQQHEAGNNTSTAKKGEQFNLLALALRSGQSPLVLGCYLLEFVALPLSVRALAMPT